jgi:hypothetical protein
MQSYMVIVLRLLFAEQAVVITGGCESKASSRSNSITRYRAACTAMAEAICFVLCNQPDVVLAAAGLLRCASGAGMFGVPYCSIFVLAAVLVQGWCRFSLIICVSNKRVICALGHSCVRSSTCRRAWCVACSMRKVEPVPTAGA